jgi:hypothetical protein
MTDIEERVAVLLGDPASQGWTAVEAVDLSTVLGIGSRRAHRRRLLRRSGGALLLAGIAALVLAVPLPHLVFRGGTATSTTVAGGPPAPPPTVPLAQLEAGNWSTMPAAPIAPRAYAAEVWTGSELLIWGGGSGSHGVDLHDDGAAYDPATRTWRKLPPAPLSARLGMAAVWTGAEMVIYGGYDVDAAHPYHVTDDAAAYDPSTDTWIRLPSPPLAPRTDALAVWTGSRVIVLGGHTDMRSSSEPVYGDGAAYDPATGDWTHIAAPAGAPAGQLDFVGALQSGHLLYAFAPWTGVSANHHYVSGVDTFAYDLGSGSWRTVRSGPISGAPVEMDWTGRYFLLQFETPGRSGVPGCSLCSGSLHSYLWDPLSGAGRLTQVPFGPYGVVWAWTGNALLALDNGPVVGTGPLGAAPMPAR